MKTYAMYCVFTADHLKKENLVISQKKEEIVFPIIQIEHNRHLHNEAHYNLQSFFQKTTYNPEILKSINFTYSDVQNNLIYKYFEEKKLDNIFDLDNDIFCLYAAVLENPYPLASLFWEKFIFIKSIQNMNSINAIVDFVIERSVL